MAAGRTVSRYLPEKGPIFTPFFLFFLQNIHSFSRQKLLSCSLYSPSILKQSHLTLVDFQHFFLFCCRCFSQKIMPPSTGWAPICCCSKSNRKKQYEYDTRDITIRINGKEELTVHNIPMPRAKSAPEVPRLQGVEVHQQLTTDSPGTSRSSHSTEDYVTARTSRDLQISHKSMSDLMREVREENGLPVTSRESLHSPSSELPLSVNELLLQEREKRLRRAVFNEEGDISSRTFTPKISSRDLNGNIETRRVSIMTITVEETVTFPAPQRPSSVMKYIAAAPQMILTVFTLSLAWITGIVTSLLR